MAVAIFDPGVILRDFHTIETVPSAAAHRPQSRPEALRSAGLNTHTTITLRDYRMAPLYGVAVRGEGLETIAEALRRPVFTLWLGRKSCPLAAPLDPQIVQAETPAEALVHLRLPPWRAGSVAEIMACDDDGQAERVETRHDVATDRQAWHFAPRRVAMVPVRIEPGART